VSFLTAHQHLLSQSVPANGVKVVTKERRYNEGYLAMTKCDKQLSNIVKVTVKMGLIK